MQRLVLALLLFTLALAPASCGASGQASGDASEPRGTSDQPFTSAEALLYDFELDGRVAAKAADISDPESLVIAQLTYAIGQLNGDRAVGRYERLELSEITVRERTSDNVEIRYHAKLPVAWAGDQAPNGYTFVLPARASHADQLAFEKKYGETCVDTSVGVADVGSMFILYRPHLRGCVLDDRDVVWLEATVAPSSEGTTGAYPEYDRLWDDGVLAVVVIVSRDIETAADDQGIQTYDEIVRKAQAYLASRQPDAALQTGPAFTGAPDATTPVKLGAVLADGRRIVIDVMLVPHMLEAGGPELDAWFDAVTPAADLVLYNGHAGLGTNIRTLSQKGSFRRGKYVVWAVNGCDTFAYLDRTLADRRAALNPDDPSGTRYMDQVSNVMPGYFKTAPAFAMTFLDAAVSAADEGGAPKSYAQLFAAIDPGQVVVVTGEEDNAFDPKTHRVWPHPATETPPSAATAPAQNAAQANTAGCAMSREAPAENAPGVLVLTLALIALKRRRAP